jgi:hypothetical protein
MLQPPELRGRGMQMLVCPPHKIFLRGRCGPTAIVLRHHVCCSAKPIGQEHKPAMSRKNPQRWLYPASSNIQRDNPYLLVLALARTSSDMLAVSATSADLVVHARRRHPRAPSWGELLLRSSCPVIAITTTRSEDLNSTDGDMTASDLVNTFSAMSV